MIDGKKISTSIQDSLRKDISELIIKYKKVPKLVVILIGKNPASISYVKAKERACKKVGIFCHVERLEENILESELINIINKINLDTETHGIIVQLPLPKSLNDEKIIQSISPSKDVDGLTNENLGLLASGNPRFVPATPLGIQILLHEINAKTEGSNIVIIGRSKLVGIPLALLLSSKSELGNATVTVCHSRSKNIRRHTIKADIVIVATGFPNTLTADMVKKGSIIIDVGVNRIEDKTKKNGYRLIGDIKFDELKDLAHKITPVPGGVGPMTISMILRNVTKAFSLKMKKLM